MENGGVKNIVLIALVVVFAFFLGSLAVDGWKDALTPLVLIIGVFGMLYLGQNSKYLIFYLPRMFGLTGINLGSIDFLSVLADVLFAYWIVMRFMGHARLKWVGHWFLDFYVLLLFLYMCSAFYRNPVAMGVLGLDLDMMGGSDYIMCLMGTVAYLAVSFIPFSALELCKTIRNVAYFNIAMSLINIALKMVKGGGGTVEAEMSMGEAAQTTRFTLFTNLGANLFVLIYGLTPIRKLWSSPWKITVLLICLISIFFCGWRGTIISFSLGIFVLAFFKRELTFLICLGALCYAGLLMLSSEHAFDELPFGVQRSLCAIPGVKVSEKVTRDAEGSSKWRVEMWGWALDPRTHYIKDYVWGDGPGTSKARVRRLQTAVMRGNANNGDNIHFAEGGIWHSGWITFMHRFGLVGLGLAVIYHSIWALFSILACLRYRSTEYYPYIAIFCRSSLPVAIMYYLGTGMPAALFSTLPSLAIYKQLYVRARELGRDDSFFRSEPYTPLMIQDIREKEGQQTLVNA